MFFFSFFLSPVVALRPGSSGDRRVEYADEDGARVFMCPRVLSRAPSVSVSRGRGEDVARTWEKALAARKTAPCHTEAISAARQPARSQRDQRKQRKTPKKRAQRNKVERGMEGGGGHGRK